MTSQSAGTHRGLVVHLGGKSAVTLFVLSLIAFVVETQLTQYVQVDLGYRQPFLIFYIVHASFAIILPLHFVFLRLTTKIPLRAYWAGLVHALQQHLHPSSSALQAASFPKWQFVRFLLLLTAGANLPGLLWFMAVSLAPITDVTALWNTNAFFAYILSVKLFKLKWEPRRLAAVILSIVGATAVVYGGSGTSPDKGESASMPNKLERAPEPSASAPLIGDLLTLSASILYGAYQVLYKIYAALPNDPEVLDTENEAYAPLTSPYDELSEEESSFAETELPEAALLHPPPFGLYPNMLTSAIGVCTFLVLWIPIPFLQFFGVARLALPTTARQALVIAGIALSGVVFNAGFMILLGFWGPIVTSVGSLLTIVMVFISDIVFGGAVDTITAWSLVGSGIIVAAFAVLAYDMMMRRH